MQLKAIMPAVLLAVAGMAAQGVPAHSQTKIDLAHVAPINHDVTKKTKAAVKAPAPAPQPAALYVLVAQGDTLSGIATSNQTTVQRLYDANMQISDPDLIFPSERLLVPAASEQLVDRPLPAAITPASTAQAAVSALPASIGQTPLPAPATLDSSDFGTWDKIAACESGGNWSIDTGNGFYGGLQFTLSSWHTVGGTGLPSQASRDEQIARAQLLQARQGWGAWPVCSVRAGA